MDRSYVITLKRSAFYTILIVVISSMLTSCSKDDGTQMSKAEILSSTRWKSAAVRDSVGIDVTAANQGFMGLAT